MVMRIIVVLAAVLSVVVIPIIFALIGHNQGAVWAEGLGIAGITTAAIGFLFTTVTYRKFSIDLNKSMQPDLKYTSNYNVIITEGPTEAQLLRELNMIEREAQALLGEGQNTSVIRLRSRLEELGIWSENDVYDFDFALRVRNVVAHGDQQELSRASVTRAVETMRRLRQKVEASQLHEPG